MIAKLQRAPRNLNKDPTQNPTHRHEWEHELPNGGGGGVGEGAYWLNYILQVESSNLALALALYTL